MTFVHTLPRLTEISKFFSLLKHLRTEKIYIYILLFMLYMYVYIYFHKYHFSSKECKIE